MDRTDAELLAGSARDPEAFGIFYDRHAERLLTYFARRTWDAQEAADLTAETFAAAFAARRRYRDTGAPAFAWLLGIARHGQFSPGHARGALRSACFHGGFTDRLVVVIGRAPEAGENPSAWPEVCGLRVVSEG
jgi:Sigma-70 region 2